jgi:hypothetical protein
MSYDHPDRYLDGKSEDEELNAELRFHLTYKIGEKLVNLVNVAAKLGHSQTRSTAKYYLASGIGEDVIENDAIDIIRAILVGDRPDEILERFPWIDTPFPYHDD